MSMCYSIHSIRKSYSFRRLSKYANGKEYACIYLFNQVNGFFQIHTEIDKFPVDTFFLVFFLFKNEHSVVEKLLEFFVGQVDTQLFKGVVLKRDKGTKVRFVCLEKNRCLVSKNSSKDNMIHDTL